jgi:peptidoglycan hydrolase-like protein with peptidoglycan-binding domain
LREWANQFGADALAPDAWERVRVLEGESSSERIKREQREARARDERRKLVRRMTQRARASQSGQRGGLGTLIAIALLAAVGLGGYGGYRWYETGQRNAAAAAALPLAQSPAALRAFLDSYRDLPIAAQARERLSALDDAAWNTADQARTRVAYESYLTAFPVNATPPPANAQEARRSLKRARDIQQAQELLASLGYFHETADGRVTRATNTAVRAFQTEASQRNPQITVTGVVDEDGLLIDDLTVFAAERARPVATAAIVLADNHPLPPVPAGQIGQTDQAPPQPAPNFLATLRAQSRAPLTRADFESFAGPLGIEWEALAAAVQIESGPLGSWDSSGRPIILFERHLFSRRTEGRFDASHPNVSNRTPGGYPRTQDARWAQLAEAYALDPDAALASTSFGRFQILGQNFVNTGAASASGYIADIARSERGELAAFVAFLRANGLIDELARKDWAGFARGYNGPGYAANQYDQKMAQAYTSLRANPIQ